MNQSVKFVVIDGICTQCFHSEVVVGYEKQFNFLGLYTRKVEISTITFQQLELALGLLTLCLSLG